ncbi:MAG TPA: hypothetical protein VHP62_01920 [Usitatibacter sp.]|nr:hypothetical protein [Usitatibacter sp.]
MELLTEIERLKGELEREQIRLAACTAAALGNTESACAQRLAPDHPYYSASYGDVCRAVDREMAYREELEMRVREAWEAGFALCRSYGDNHAHFEGEQKERKWRLFLDQRPCTPTKSAP